MKQAEVVVVGGGPAGSSAAIRLAQRGLRVLLLEKATLPRDKLCGEFLSPEVARMCASLGVLEDMRQAGARPIHRVELTAPSGAAFSGRLPSGALSLSRRTLDHLLIKSARTAGAEVQEGEAVVDVSGSLDDGFRIETRERPVVARVVLGAYGRREMLDRRLSRPSLARRSSFVAFKARHAGALPEGMVELHAFKGGYCGLVGDETGTVNVCWLARVERLAEAGGSPEAMVEHVLFTNPHLHVRLAALTRCADYMAVGQLSTRPKETFASDVCMIGDAAGMIAPLCGDGIGMALRSAEIAAALVERYLHGRLSSDGFRTAYRRRWHREFALRMHLGRFLNAVLTHSAGSRIAVQLSAHAPSLAGAVITATRG